MDVYKKLSLLQSAFNSIVIKDWETKISKDQWALAIHQETAELIDSYPWKWWKDTSHLKIDLDNVKIELTDILHFALAGKYLVKKEDPLSESCEKSFLSIKNSNNNSALIYLAISNLAINHRFQEVIESCFILSESLGFNLPAYYLAKHTLNYIRQLGGYKDGTYQKMNNGQEDNEVLHEVIQKYSTDDILNKFDECYKEISTEVYEKFQIPPEQRKSLEDWLN